MRGYLGNQIEFASLQHGDPRYRIGCGDKFQPFERGLIVVMVFNGFEKNIFTDFPFHKPESPASHRMFPKLVLTRLLKIFF